MGRLEEGHYRLPVRAERPVDVAQQLEGVSEFGPHLGDGAPAGAGAGLVEELRGRVEGNESRAHVSVTCLRVIGDQEPLGQGRP